VALVHGGHGIAVGRVRVVDLHQPRAAPPACVAKDSGFVDPSPVRAAARPVGRPRCAHWNVRGGNGHEHVNRSLSTQRPRCSIGHSHQGVGEPVVYSPLREHGVRPSSGQRTSVRAWRCLPLLLIRLIVRKMWLAIAVTLFVGLPFLPGGVAALATYSFLISLGGRPAFGGTVSAPAVSGR